MGDNAEKKRVITISREYGSGGRLIGKRLAEKLRVPYYDRDTINERISRESGYDKDMFAGQEKKAKNSFLYSLASAMGTGEAGPESLSLNERLFLAQFDTIRKIAEEADKIKRAVEQYGDPPDQVRKIMRAADKARANYYAYHTGRKWGEHVNFNLSLDSGYLELEDAVDLIITYTEKQIWRESTLDDEQY